MDFGERWHADTQLRWLIMDIWPVFTLSGGCYMYSGAGHRTHDHPCPDAKLYYGTGDGALVVVRVHQHAGMR